MEKKWEYLIEEFSMESENGEPMDQFNEAGENGWEIIAVWPQPGVNPGGKFQVLYKKPRN